MKNFKIQNSAIVLWIIKKKTFKNNLAYVFDKCKNDKKYQVKNL